MAILLAALLALCEKTAMAADFTGYVVTAQWDGRTVPDVQWALDLTRQDTEYRLRQELKLQKLLPTTIGPALSPTWTAYSPGSRSYFTSVRKNKTAAYLWGMAINNNVNATTPICQTTFGFPQEDAVFVGLEAFDVNGATTVLAFFQDGTILDVDYSTGSTTDFANLVGGSSAVVSTSITVDHINNTLYAVLDSKPHQIVTFDLVSKKVTNSVAIGKLKDHDDFLELPFEMVKLPDSGDVLLFYDSELFDQILFVDTTTGDPAFLFNDIAEFGEGTYGHFEFTANDRLEDNDLWGTVCLDTLKDKIYFQCSAVDDSGFVTTTMCEIPVPKKRKAGDFINTAIQPMTYGYAGFQYVEVVG